MLDTSHLTPGRPYVARVYYYACREDVEAMLAKGYNIRNVYEHMKEQGRFACGYSAFCDYVRGGGKRLHSRKKAGGTKPSSHRQDRLGQESFARPMNRFLIPGLWTSKTASKMFLPSKGK